MHQLLIGLLFLSMLATFAVMMAGILCMARGGEVNKKHSNKFMQWRVICQGVALACLAALVTTGG
jgi:predicted permease